MRQNWGNYTRTHTHTHTHTHTQAYSTELSLFLTKLLISTYRSNKIGIGQRRSWDINWMTATNPFPLLQLNSFFLSLPCSIAVHIWLSSTCYDVFKADVQYFRPYPCTILDDLWCDWACWPKKLSFEDDKAQDGKTFESSHEEQSPVEQEYPFGI